MKKIIVLVLLASVVACSQAHAGKASTLIGVFKEIKELSKTKMVFAYIPSFSAPKEALTGITSVAHGISEVSPETKILAGVAGLAVIEVIEVIEVINSCPSDAKENARETQTFPTSACE